MKKHNQKGQALIELIIFMPLMFTLYALISGFANAIYGSINQQKITRSYFYFRTQNSSTLPKPDGTPAGFPNNWRQFGMFFIGWRNTMLNDAEPIMPCYKISLPLGANGGDVCEESYKRPTTQYIRVGTVYGICGATYTSENNQAVPMPDYGSNPFEVVNDRGCHILQ